MAFLVSQSYIQLVMQHLNFLYLLVGDSNYSSKYVYWIKEIYFCILYN
jgi:hypothetical protein